MSNAPLSGTDDLPARPRGLQLIDSAGVAAALETLAAARGVEIRTLSSGSQDEDARAIRLQSVPPTADEHWFIHVGLGFVPVRFHLSSGIAELVILAGQTEAQCSAAADILVQLGLQVLLAPARPGLVVDRIRHAYLNEGLALLGEGLPASAIEQAAVEAGFRAGPLALLDEQGLDTTDRLYHQSLGGSCCGHDHDHSHDHAHGNAQDHDDGHHHDHAHGHDHGRHAACQSHAHDHDHGHHDHRHDHAHAHGHATADGNGHVHADGHDGHAHDHDHDHDDHDGPSSGQASPGSWPILTDEAVYVMEKMAHGFQRKGRAAGSGFYDYEDDGDGEEEAELWSGLARFERRGVRLSADELRDRLRFIACVEVLRALATRVMPTTSAAGLATQGADLWPEPAVHPLAQIEAIGREDFARRAAELARRHGERFALPEGWQQHLPG